MKSLALVVGNADYKENLKLNNSVNDAKDMADKLETLGYEVLRKFNCTEQEFHEVVAEFGHRMREDSCEAGLFYFSGHGVQIDGLNYLTPITTNFSDESSVKYTSLQLAQLIETMRGANLRIKILILDACRDNPFPNTYRSGGISSGLAPVHAPKGTIIAFSTSPGERAKDAGMGRNSIYTGTMLKHIDDRNIPIEEVFKRVRTSVYTLTKGQQTSWEHTSLIGDYYFNYGQRTYSPRIPYRPDVVEDSVYISDGSILGSIIKGLKSCDWYKQEPAIKRITKANLQDADQSDLFLIGRNILQAAEGSSHMAIAVLDDPIQWRNGFTPQENIHLINGMLFEVYFDSKGKFRGEENLKSALLPKLLEYQANSSYKHSFDFIREQLQPFVQDLFYIPGNPNFILAIEIQFEKILNTRNLLLEEGEESYEVTSIKHQEIELLYNHNTRTYKNSKSYRDFKEELSCKLHIPAKQLRIIMEVSEAEISKVEIPYNYKLTRNPPPVDLDF